MLSRSNENPEKKYADASLAAADSLALPMDDEDSFDEPAITENEKAKTETTKKILTKKIVFCLSSVLLIAIIVLSVVLTRAKDSGGNSADKVLTGDTLFSAGPELNDIYSLLKTRVDNPDALLDAETPEGKAFSMLVEERKVNPSTALRSDFYTQRYALLVLFLVTNGENWTNKAGWSTQSDACENWYGVVCIDSMVIGIDFDVNNLSGKIPEDFCLLSDLEFLRLDGNMVQLPSCLGKLSELRELDYRNNKFAGELPGGLYAIPSLRTLLLSNNEFVGSIDALFANAKSNEAFFPNLRNLNLSNNNLSGEIPESVLRRLPTLDVLLMHGNPQLSGSLDEMCKGDELSSIDVDCDQVSCRCCTLGQNCPSSPLSV